MEREQLNKLSKLLDKKEVIEITLKGIEHRLISIKDNNRKPTNFYLDNDYISKYMSRQDIEIILKNMQEVVNREYKEICEECDSYIVSKKVD